MLEALKKLKPTHHYTTPNQTNLQWRGENGFIEAAIANQTIVWYGSINRNSLQGEGQSLDPQLLAAIETLQI